MQTCYLPIGDFELVDMPLSEVLQTAEHSPYGFIVEVDLEYPRNSTTFRVTVHSLQPEILSKLSGWVNTRRIWERK